MKFTKRVLPVVAAVLCAAVSVAGTAYKKPASYTLSSLPSTAFVSGVPVPGSGQNPSMGVPDVPVTTQTQETQDVAESKSRPQNLDLPAPNTSPVANSSYPTECEGHVIAAWIIMRESGCRYDAYSATGCSGRGCVGLYQLDEGHFAAVSPWNPNVSGVCYGLTYSPADQDECASRLGPGAWG